MLIRPTFRYKQNAVKTAAMLNDKPFTAREVFVRNMEFLAKHGPLRQLDHHGRHLNFFQYYLIDVVGAVVLTISVTVVIVLFTIVKILRCISGGLIVSRKSKKE